LTLVPIFVVFPTLGIAGFFLRHKLVSLAKKCCGSTPPEDKDLSKVRRSNN
jgi:hypothetical protein